MWDEVPEMLNVLAFGTGRSKAERGSLANTTFSLLGNINESLEIGMLLKIAWKLLVLELIHAH